MNKTKLKELTQDWFLSDLDIEFCLKDKETKELALCIFESDAWYEHINNSRGVTIRSIRHKGENRRFIVVSCSDSMFTQLKQHCYQLYDLTEIIELIENFSFQIVSSEKWKD